MWCRLENQRKWYNDIILACNPGPEVFRRQQSSPVEIINLKKKLQNTEGNLANSDKIGFKSL